MRPKQFTSNKEYQKEWYKLNKEYAREREIEYAQQNREKLLYHQAKSSAKRRGLEFSLEESDIVIPTHCPILGIELTKVRGAGRIKSNVSLDRKDSTKGYTKENIWVVSDLANRMKSNANPEELLLFAQGILRLYGPTVD